jgi:hypothetical protein
MGGLFWIYSPFKVFSVGSSLLGILYCLLGGASSSGLRSAGRPGLWKGGGLVIFIFYSLL